MTVTQTWMLILSESGTWSGVRSDREVGSPACPCPAPLGPRHAAPSLRDPHGTPGLGGNTGGHVVGTGSGCGCGCGFCCGCERPRACPPCPYLCHLAWPHREVHIHHHLYHLPCPLPRTDHPDPCHLDQARGSERQTYPACDPAPMPAAGSQTGRVAAPDLALALALPLDPAPRLPLWQQLGCARAHDLAPEGRTEGGTLAGWPSWLAQPHGPCPPGAEGRPQNAPPLLKLALQLHSTP